MALVAGKTCTKGQPDSWTQGAARRLHSPPRCCDARRVRGNATRKGIHRILARDHAHQRTGHEGRGLTSCRLGGGRGSGGGGGLMGILRSGVHWPGQKLSYCSMMLILDLTSCVHHAAQHIPHPTLLCSWLYQIFLCTSIVIQDGGGQRRMTGGRPLLTRCDPSGGQQKDGRPRKWGGGVLYIYAVPDERGRQARPCPWPDKA